MQTVTKNTISTKRSKDDAEGTATVITINWDGMTDSDLQALAQQTIIIKRQQHYRKHGIPASDEINAVDYKVGIRRAKAKAETAEESFAKLPHEEQMAIFKKYGMAI